MIKLYAQNECFVLKGKNDIEFFKSLYYIGKETNHSDNYKQIYKRECNLIRKHFEISNVVGIAVNDEKVMIFVYDLQATTDNFYLQKYDEKGFYIEVTAEEMEALNA